MAGRSILFFIQIEKYAIPNVQLFVLGNKVDCPEDLRKVTTEEAESFCKSRNLVFTEVSAKSGDHIVESFHKVAESLTRIYPKEERKAHRNTALDEIAKKKK